MIRLIVILAILGISIVTGAQIRHHERRVTVQYNNGSAQFEQVIKVEKQFSDSIIKIVDRWAAATFNSAGDVIKVRTGNGLIGGVIEQGIVLTKFPKVMGYLKYSFQIRFEKDAVYFRMYAMQIHTDLDHTYSFEDYVFDSYGCEVVEKQGRAVKDHATRIANVLVNSLKIFLNGQ